MLCEIDTLMLECSLAQCDYSLAFGYCCFSHLDFPTCKEDILVPLFAFAPISLVQTSMEEEARRTSSSSRALASGA
jgi:hypothetical protein